jgi:hypothetical protein
MMVDAGVSNTNERCERGTASLRGALVSILFLSACSALGQMASDTVPRERTIPRREQMDRDLEEARVHLGPFRIEPLFGLRDVGYENNVFGTTENPVADWRATVSAGADVILPIGSKTYLLGRALPEYTWYSKVTNRRAFGGTYGGSYVALFNRLSLEAGAQTANQIAPVSSEVEQSIPGTRDEIYARAEIEIFRRFSLFGSARRQGQRYDTSDEQLPALAGRLERDEDLVRAGVRYKWRSWLDFSAAVEEGGTEFVSALNRDNDTRAVLFGIHYDRPRVFLSVSAGQREGRPRGTDSIFPAFTTTTGSYYLEYQLGAPPRLDVYGHRNVRYSLTDASPYFFENRNGAGLTIPIGTRFGVRLLGELGSNDYPVVAGQTTPKRTDSVTLIGTGVAVRLYRKTYLSVVASETRYDSNLDFDRSILRVTTLISLRGQAFR